MTSVKPWPAFILAIALTACQNNAGLSPNQVVDAKRTLSTVPNQHRPVAVSCEGVFSPSEPSPQPVFEDGACTRHADCTAGKNGHCVVGYRGSYYCAYDTCTTDGDCPGQAVCQCSASYGSHCMESGDCRVDADCGTGDRAYCSPTPSTFDCSGYHPVTGYRCHTPRDTCTEDSDCAAKQYCTFDPYQSYWRCFDFQSSCVIG